jgi:hypothetical protein
MGRVARRSGVTHGEGGDADVQMIECVQGCHSMSTVIMSQSLVSAGEGGQRSCLYLD